MKRPLVIAHRGASALAAENTVEALEAAIALDADFAEFDVRVSRDNVPFCCHDANLFRVTGYNESVANLDAQQLSALGLLPLVELLKLARGRIPLLLDCKAETALFFSTIAHAVAEAKAENEPIVLGVRSLDASRMARTSLPRLSQLGLLASEVEFAAFVADGGACIRLWESDADAESMSRLRQTLGRPIWITLGAPGKGNAGEAGPEALARILALEPDGILVNDPRLMATSCSVQDHGRRSS